MMTNFDLGVVFDGLFKEFCAEFLCKKGCPLTSGVMEVCDKKSKCAVGKSGYSGGEDKSLSPYACWINFMKEHVDFGIRIR